MEQRESRRTPTEVVIPEGQTRRGFLTSFVAAALAPAITPAFAEFGVPPAPVKLIDIQTDRDIYHQMHVMVGRFLIDGKEWLAEVRVPYEGVSEKGVKQTDAELLALLQSCFKTAVSHELPALI